MLLKNDWLTLNLNYPLTNTYRPTIKFEDWQNQVDTSTTKQPFNIARKNMQNLRKKKKKLFTLYYSIIPSHVISFFFLSFMFLSCYLFPWPKIINKIKAFFWRFSLSLYIYIYLLFIYFSCVFHYTIFFTSFKFFIYLLNN